MLLYELANKILKTLLNSLSNNIHSEISSLIQIDKTTIEKCSLILFTLDNRYIKCEKYVGTI